MNDADHDLELEDIEDILEEEFQPELFYKALSNALEQLKQIASDTDSETAAA